MPDYTTASPGDLPAGPVVAQRVFANNPYIGEDGRDNSPVANVSASCDCSKLEEIEAKLEEITPGYNQCMEQLEQYWSEEIGTSDGACEYAIYEDRLKILAPGMLDWNNHLT